MSKWRHSREYRVWRVKVIRRDGQCVICGSRKHRHAHHLDSAAYHMDKRFKVDNGVTLCRGCHTKYHTDFNRSYRVKTTLYNFKNFQSLVKYLRGVL
jgi:replicative DNA helicase Mcm